MKKFALLFTLLLTSVVHAQEVEILVDGRPHRTVTLQELRKLQYDVVEFYNSVTHRAERYRGVSFFNLLQKYAPEALPAMIEMEFKTTNHFDSFVPRELFDKTYAIFSYERADGDTFTRYSQKQRLLVSLGPLYLVWDLKKVSKDERLFYSSVYQIEKINLITNKDDFGVNEEAVDKSVYLGFQAYKRNCIACHALGKHGGQVSVNLVQQKILAYRGADYVRKYILDPRSQNPKTQMLPIPNYKNRDEIVKGIIDFLNFMKDPEVLLKKKIANKSSSSYKELREIVDSAAP